eukprot:scaffold24876_cov77-Isochrysis_galbana.AAC.3
MATSTTLPFVGTWFGRGYYGRVWGGLMSAFQVWGVCVWMPVVGWEAAVLVEGAGGGRLFLGGDQWEGSGSFGDGWGWCCR